MERPSSGSESEVNDANEDGEYGWSKKSKSAKQDTENDFIINYLKAKSEAKQENDYDLLYLQSLLPEFKSLRDDMKQPVKSAFSKVIYLAQSGAVRQLNAFAYGEQPSSEPQYNHGRESQNVRQSLYQCAPQLDQVYPRGQCVSTYRGNQAPPMHAAGIVSREQLHDARAEVVTYVNERSYTEL